MLPPQQGSEKLVAVLGAAWQSHINFKKKQVNKKSAKLLQKVRVCFGSQELEPGGGAGARGPNTFATRYMA